MHSEFERKEEGTRYANPLISFFLAAGWFKSKVDNCSPAGELKSNLGLSFFLKKEKGPLRSKRSTADLTAHEQRK